MSPANPSEERISLYEFMPYGAPELMEVAKQYMFRATMAAIGSMIGIFVMMFVTNLIISRQREDPVEPPGKGFELVALACLGPGLRGHCRHARRFLHQLPRDSTLAIVRSIDASRSSSS